MSRGVVHGQNTKSGSDRLARCGLFVAAQAERFGPGIGGNRGFPGREHPRSAARRQRAWECWQASRIITG
jgi:hypothetical protein